MSWWVVDRSGPCVRHGDLLRDDEEELLGPFVDPVEALEAIPNDHHALQERRRRLLTRVTHTDTVGGANQPT